MQGFSADEIFNNSIAKHPELQVHSEALAEIIEDAMINTFPIARRLITKNLLEILAELIPKKGNEDLHILFASSILASISHVSEEEMPTERGNA